MTIPIHERLQPHVTNPLPAVSAAVVTGIVGDAPSRYAKTPPLWNGVYRELGWPAVSLAWDVLPEALPAFVAAVRRTPEIAGFNVTTPHKLAIVPLLDAIDAEAARIGAVNTVVRASDGQLSGSNTDGRGAIDALTRQLPGQAAPFLPSLSDRRVLLIGAGGAARAVAFALSHALGPGGHLRIVTRAAAKAQALAEAVSGSRAPAEGGGEARLREWSAAADLLINASIKGQAGWHYDADGCAFQIEPYSALGPADPPRLAAGRALDSTAARDWFAAARGDLSRNLGAGLEATAALAATAICVDLIYAPLETRFLSDARIAGHDVQNGRWMNIAQAADAFARIFPDALAAAGLAGEAGCDRVLEIMARVW